MSKSKQEKSFYKWYGLMKYWICEVFNSTTYKLNIWKVLIFEVNIKIKEQEEECIDNFPVESKSLGNLHSYVITDYGEIISQISSTASSSSV